MAVEIQEDWKKSHPGSNMKIKSEEMLEK